MPALLLVGEWADSTTAALANRGYDLGRVESAEAASERVESVDCAVVRAGADGRAAVEAVDAAAPEVPVLYAADPGDATGIEGALSAGASEAVVLTRTDATARLLGTLERLVGSPRTADASVRADSDDRETAPRRDRTRPPSVRTGESPAPTRPIRTLLECAGQLQDAESATAVGEIVVTAAEQALGYDLLTVHLLDDDGDTLCPVAWTGQTREVLDELDPVPVAEAPAEAAIRDGRTIDVDPEDVPASDVLADCVVVPLGTHGVVCVGAASPGGLSAADRRVVELLAANAAAALDRIRRVERVERLHRATRSMLDAETTEAVAERAVEAAESVLGYSYVGLHLLDDPGEWLEPVAWTDATEADLGPPQPVEADAGGPWTAFERGEALRYDESDEDACQYPSPFESQMHVPIGDVGLLVVAAYEPGSFDESDLQLARLLATNTARTLERVDRTQELEGYESVFETVTDLVFVLDEDGGITHATPALAEWLDYDHPDLLGEHVSTVIDDPEAISRGVDLVQALVGEPATASRTVRTDLATGDGEAIPAEIEMTLLPGEGFRGVVGSVRDISDLLAVRERLDSQQDRFEYLFEHIPDPVVEVDFDGEAATVVSVNGAFEEVFGFAAAEIRDRSINEVIVPPEDHERARELDRRAHSGEVSQATLERETQYGIREFLFRGVPYTTGDGATRGFGIYTDITDQHERERHLGVLQRVLRHNVRNDVNVLQGAIDRLEVDDTDPDTIAILRETTDGLLALSQKAKRIGRVLEDGRTERSSVDLATLADDVVERYRSLDVDAAIATDLPDSAAILGSPAIEYALEDLVGNAVEHAGDTPQIDVHIDVDGDRTRITVSDDGPGIPEAERVVLQEAEITPLRHGSGLGLWLVKHATAASGGTVSFDDTDDGATVTLSFRTAETGSE